MSSYPSFSLPPLPSVAGPCLSTGGDHPMGLIPAEQVDLFGLADASSAIMTTGRLLWGLASTIAGGALIYHGYKRNDSVGWALVWGIPGGLVWPITLPIALAQGFGKRK